MLVRVPVEVADRLASQARAENRSVSDRAAELIIDGLNGRAG